MLAKRHNLNRMALVSIVLAAALLVIYAASFWRHAGWVRTDESWVTPPGANMMELHTRARVWIICRGRVEVAESKFLSAVIPAGSSAAGKPKSESVLLWQPSEPTRIRSWDDRWHISRCDEWRMGDFGWFASTGGGSSSRVFAVPLWLLSIVAGIPGWIGIGRAVRSKLRMKRGLCQVCGYDRRDVTSLTLPCPECGTLPR